MGLNQIDSIKQMRLLSVFPAINSCKLKKIWPGIFSWALKKIYKDILRIKVGNILHEEMRICAENMPLFSAQESKIISETLGECLRKHPGLSSTELRNITAIFHLALIAILPKLTKENLEDLFEVVLDEVKDHGGMFGRK